MSRQKAIQTSRDRLAANFIVAIPAGFALLMIWLYQQSKAGASPQVDGHPALPL